MKVAILIGSSSDLPKVQGAITALKEFDIDWELKVMSAHRSPSVVEQYVCQAPVRGINIFICCAGLAAHLAGCVAGHTHLPVIGVPLSGSSLGGQDSLLATVQMPKGVPVATVAIDGSYNAGLLAVQMLAISDKELSDKLIQFKKNMVDKVLEADNEMRDKISDMF